MRCAPVDRFVTNRLSMALVTLALAGCSASRSTAATASESASQASVEPSHAMLDAGMPRMAASSPASADAATAAKAICEVGATRSCSGTGTQICRRIEINDWGPCLQDAGQVSHDAGHDSGLDAGVMPDAGHSCGPDMECKPGSIRYCDE